MSSDVRNLLLKGKVVLITGGAQGIGFAIAKEFAENNGAVVFLGSRDIKKASRASRAIKGKTFAVQIDVTKHDEVKKSIQKIIAQAHSIDILINNAGYKFDRSIWFKKIHDVSESEVSKIIEVDLKGTFRLCKNVIPFMIKNSKGRGGVIINISSTPAISGYDKGSPYSLAKAGNIALTKHIAYEYGIDNIRAYTLALGNIASDATYKTLNPVEKRRAKEEPAMKRWGRPDEVAKIAACISSDKFSFATGNTIVIDGGKLLY